MVPADGNLKGAVVKLCELFVRKLHVIEELEEFPHRFIHVIVQVFRIDQAG